jgi:hypothetical protein
VSWLEPNVLTNAPLVFSLTGEVGRANKIIQKLQTQFPKDTFINQVWIPVAQATQEWANSHSKHAVELLDPSRMYELGQDAEFSPIYWRAMAYLRENAASDASIEFQKIIEHKGVSPTSEFLALSLLGLARAAAAGNPNRSRLYYEQFLNQWKDADLDVHILQQARGEYAKLLIHIN